MTLEDKINEIDREARGRGIIYFVANSILLSVILTLVLSMHYKIITLQQLMDNQEDARKEAQIDSTTYLEASNSITNIDFKSQE